jgi:quaternary ammonium compound-resistance protein SugE
MTGAWLSLLFAGTLEIAWALALKMSQGFSKPLPAATAVILMILSFVFLAFAMKHLPVGTAYPVWTGIGAVGTAIFGIIYMGESASPLRIVCIFLIVLGALGLKALTPSH